MIRGEWSINACVTRREGWFHYAGCMPDENSPATHVLSAAGVRWAIDTLGSRRLHPTLVMYLYLRKQERAGVLAEASASSDELLALIDLPGNPNKPYYFPLIDRGKRTGKPLASFWRSANIPGSWSPGSIRRQPRGGWLGADASFYALPQNHAERALQDMLYGEPVSALALGAYFLRNDGFILSGQPTALDVIDGFRLKFDFPSSADSEFATLFVPDIPVVDFEWFEETGVVDEMTGESSDA